MQRRRIGLLALLAVARERGLTRDRLTGYLWPDAQTDHARRLLSDSVYRINQLCAGEALTAAGADLRLNHERLPSDVWEFAAAMDRHDWRAAVALQPAPFMDGYYLTDARELEGWVDAQRERLARERARALEHLANDADHEDDATAAIRWWRMLAEQEPYSSRVALALARALHRAGDPAGALRHIDSHSGLLRTEIGVAPDAELVAFADELRSTARGIAPSGTRASLSATGAAPSGTRASLSATGAVPTVTRAAPSGTSAAPTASGAASSASPAVGRFADGAADTGGARGVPYNAIAVLPFVIMGDAPDDVALADGMTDDVIAQLSKVKSLRVTSRASVMPFRGDARDLGAIGDTLGVRTLLTGSVRRAGDRVRIVVQLVEVTTGGCLWASTYDRWLTDVFAIQSDVALRIADALQAELSADERMRIRREPTRDLHAYQLYLQGRYCLQRFTAEGLLQAIEYFERAIDIDPDFALAWTGIALAALELVSAGRDPVREYGRAREAVGRALALDPDLAEAHCMLGQIRATSDYDWAGAERAFQRALELNPSSADTCDFYGRMCSGLGRYDSALALIARAQQLDPMAHRADYAGTLLRAGRYADAVEAAERAVAFDPHYHRTRAILGWAYLKTGRTEAGLAELEAATQLGQDVTMWLGQLGQAYAMTGRTDAARSVLERLERSGKERYVSPYHIAYVHTGLGEHERAIDLLERAFEQRAGAIYGVAGSFLFEPLRGHPRFRALLERMNIPAQ